MWPAYIKITPLTRLRSHNDLCVSVTLLHSNGEQRTVQGEHAYKGPPRIEVWWGNGAGMYTLDLVSNKLLRAENWRCKNLKPVWLAWFEALHIQEKKS
jgi:hypothetical protein